MAKVPYSKLNLKVNTEVNTFEFNNLKIDVLKYLPIEDKYDLISIVLQKSEIENIYSDLHLDMYFHLYLIYMYTNISFTEKQKEDELKLYNSLKSSGFIDKFLQTIEENEYNELYEILLDMKNAKIKYKESLSGLITNIIDKMPINAEMAAKAVDNFNPENFKEIMNLVETIDKKDLNG